jgi:hypothetical protein
MSRGMLATEVFRRVSFRGLVSAGHPILELLGVGFDAVGIGVG